MVSPAPANTRPPATAGESSKKPEEPKVHPTARPSTVEGDSTFSYGFTPVWSGPYLTMGQSVLTVNGAEADNPELSPVAVTVWSPGRAPFGTLMCAVKAPEGSVVARPRGRESKNRSTTSEGPNPRPTTVSLVVGGPTWGDRWIWGPGAAIEDGVMARMRASAGAAAASIWPRERFINRAGGTRRSS